mmetsp:Transcript_12722/g.27651  ORF Transcript_12722/g.27651 Transcript_12722/m.27651 type:complete len:280 (+) Transcript_12722:354-1193(+)
MSTSNPRSLKPLAMTFAPRSCPSWPIFATKILGLRPSLCSNFFTSSNTYWYSDSLPQFCDLLSAFVKEAPYAPCTIVDDGTWRPHAFSRAKDISPRVQRARAALMHKAIKLLELSPMLVLLSNLALASRAVSAAFASFSSLIRFNSLRRSTCICLTAVLSICKTSCRSSSASLASSRYLFMPTMMSCPESIRPCFLVALSSIRNLAIPLLMYAVMPPAASTSSMISIAFSASSSVRLSIMYEPPHGSATAQIPASSWRINWVLRATRAVCTVGRPVASS